jgi:uncharacterized protein YcbX
MSLTIRSLHIYPIKSCGGIDLDVSPIDQGGLRLDRQWMLVTPGGQFMSQRTLPKMALIAPSLEEESLVIDAPGMSSIKVPVRDSSHLSSGDRQTVTVWRDTLAARSEGHEAAQWFSEFLNIKCCLVRVHVEAERYANADRVAGWLSSNPLHAAAFERNHRFGFADGFPLLVANQASLDDLNAKLQGGGHAAVPMNRFRPNIVIDGLDAYEEDFTTLIEIEDIRLALVKPCTRCSIPNVDQTDASVHTEPGITLTRFRSFDAGVIFGQNAVVAAPSGAQLKVGAVAHATMDF